jgi:hypothetical protein
MNCAVGDNGYARRVTDAGRGHDQGCKGPKNLGPVGLCLKFQFMEINHAA